MNILADPQIPQVNSYFKTLGDVTFIDPPKIKCQLNAADILLVRSDLQVNQNLLGRSSVRLVGTATSGMDHLDLDYLRQNHIKFASAKGANAKAVADYVVICVLALLNRIAQERLSLRKLQSWMQKQPLGIKPLCLGIVGFGHTGRAVAACMSAFGLDYCFYDPLLDKASLSVAQLERRVSFEQVIAADIVSLHVPLTQDGGFPTYHLFSAEAFNAMAAGTILVNASRGDVIDPDALGAALVSDQPPIVALDVWPNEPNFDPELLSLVEIATPHIAGYSRLGKLGATCQLFSAVCQCLDATFDKPAQAFVGDTRCSLSFPSKWPAQHLLKAPDLLFDACAWLVNILDLEALRQSLIDGVHKHKHEPAKSFQRVRSTYSLRDEVLWS